MLLRRVGLINKNISRAQYSWRDISTNSNVNSLVLGLDAYIGPDSPRVLIVGDGDFSYTEALSSALNEANCSNVSVYATSLDSREDLSHMYPDALRRIDNFISQSKNVMVFHGINATDLNTYKNTLGVESYHRIVFNFPHFAEGGNVRNKISLHRKLLTHFFSSCNSVLTPNGQIWLTLCAGQGGTPAETVVRSYGDSWQVVECAAAGRMILLDVMPFPFGDLTARGYRSVGYLLKDQRFHSENGLIHIFGNESIAKKSCFPQTWSRDVSVWVGARFTQGMFEECFRDTMGPGIPFQFDMKDEYHCNKSHRRSVMFRVKFMSSTHNFTRLRLNEYIQLIGKRLEERDVGKLR